MENYLRRFLTFCRLLLVIPVLGCIVLCAGVVTMGVARMVTDGIVVLQKGDFSAKASKKMSLSVIEIIDLFLIGTVAYITAIGLFKLFISKNEIPLPIKLKIGGLKDLEDKIIGVLVAALAVAFVGHAAGGDEAGELLNYGAGIALVIASLALFTYAGGKKSPDKERGSDDGPSKRESGA